MKKQISKKIPNIIFCRGGYMKYYRGITEDDSEILKGGKYNEEGNIGHECFNFYTCSDGKCYGFVQIKDAGNLNIDLIASDTNKFKITDRAYIDGVTVIFIANNKVVGYYKNARAYRLMQKRENITEGGNDYYFVCDSNDAVLIEEKERENYTIPKKQKNWMGQANIFYAQKEEIYDEIINLLNKLKLGIPMTENDTKKDIDNTIYLPKNIILYGPPGTGKTFNTMAYAVAIIEKKNFNEVKVEADDDYSKVKDRYENYKTTGLIDFVTFHQSYGYEEFVQGIKPVTKNGSISYEVQDGIFKKFCDNAKKDKNSSYVFIIDEINRGNISKIFGELITLIEDTKREGADEEMKVTLPYIDKEGQPVSFSVPQNVYIIGTMNTADRSIAAMDTALRRRFQFEEMMPKAELLEGIQIIDQSGNDTKINVQSILETINRRIEALYDREHTIGHAYFMPLRESGTLEKLADIFKTKIIPLLQEYFYDDYEKIRLVLGDNQKKDDRQFVSKKEVNNTQLFGEGVDELLSDNRYTYEIKSAVFGSPDAYRYIYESDRTSVKVEE